MRRIAFLRGATISGVLLPTPPFLCDFRCVISGVLLPTPPFLLN